MDYCNVCIVTHSLQSIHWRASDARLHFTKPELKKRIYILSGPRVSIFSEDFPNINFPHIFEGTITIIQTVRLCYCFPNKMMSLLIVTYQNF